MKVIIHDLDESYNEFLSQKCDEIIVADGKYAPCQGCFDCWMKTPAKCKIKDKLFKICRTIGNADEVIIITRNVYGTYSPQIKNVIDRSIGISTTFSTYRKGQMHHVSRYGWHNLLKVITYGDINDGERMSFVRMTERNAINHSFKKTENIFVSDKNELMEVML